LPDSARRQRQARKSPDLRGFFVCREQSSGNFSRA
jgi:hypothetical protein